MTDNNEQPKKFEKLEVPHLEDEYPLHDRRWYGYKLIGFVQGAKPKNKSTKLGEYKNPSYPYGAVPIHRYLGYDFGKKYDGATLRKLRAEFGVGNKRKIKRDAETNNQAV